MEYLLPTIMLNGTVWPSLFCPREFAELHVWIQQAKGPMLGLGYVVDVSLSSRFNKILELLAGTPDVSNVILFFFVVQCSWFSCLVMVCDSVVIMFCGNIVFMRCCGDYCVYIRCSF